MKVARVVAKNKPVWSIMLSEIATIGSRFSRAVDLTAREAIRLNYLKTTSKTFLENVKILKNVLG